MRLERGRIKLRGQNIADCVALELPTDVTTVLVDVLKTAIAIIDRLEAKIGSHCRAPSLGKVLHPELAPEQLQLAFEAQHDV